uniref:NADH-ubiquinone oxidoreductase chain 2 n=1 Tax=Kuwayamaea chinensis TaxID=1945532 RepID=A0A1Q1MPW0_9ORTH|nr:NADH dehydrogenase subunit 2 [Kuwayamaea chinensis]AQM40109.1 NADH dehydrogenase subunit 2 [Kuwayamaea chinensis]
MIMNPSKLLFICTLMFGTLITISSGTWLGAWMGLEINLLSFIPLMTSSKNILSTEASLKYFLVQALASSILLFSILFLYLNEVSSSINHTILSCLISSSLLLKMGAAPFHFWFPGTMEGLNWMNCLILMTWQKLAPFLLLSYMIPLNTFSFLIIVSCIIIGSLGGVNQTSLRKLLAYSSITHMGWMISSMSIDENIWILYFLIYCFLSSSLIFLFHSFQLFYMNQNFMIYMDPIIKFFMFLLLLSLGGLPPFLGFLPKWLVIQYLTETEQLFLITLMVTTTLLTLFYYLRLTFSTLLFSYQEVKWNKMTFYNNSIYTLLLILTSISTFGLLICVKMPSLL